MIRVWASGLDSEQIVEKRGWAEMSAKIATKVVQICLSWFVVSGSALVVSKRVWDW